MNSKERRAEIDTRHDAIESVRVAVREKTAAGTLTVLEDREAAALVDRLNGEIHALITEGANPCPNCGEEIVAGEGGAVVVRNTIRGLRHEAQGGKGRVLYTFEVGCKNSACVNVRSIDFLPELAVERFNAGDYDQSRMRPAPEAGAPRE